MSRVSSGEAKIRSNGLNFESSSSPCIECVRNNRKCEGVVPYACVHCNNTRTECVDSITLKRRVPPPPMYGDNRREIFPSLHILSNNVMSYSRSIQLINQFYESPQTLYLLQKPDSLKLLAHIFQTGGSKASPIHRMLYHSLLCTCLSTVEGESAQSNEYYMRSVSYNKNASSNGKYTLELVYSYLFLAAYCSDIGNIGNAVGYSQLASSMVRTSKKNVHFYNTRFQMFIYFISDITGGIVLKLRQNENPLFISPSIREHDKITRELGKCTSQFHTKIINGYVMKFGRVNTTITTALLEHLKMDLNLDCMSDNINPSTVYEKLNFIKLLQPYIDEVPHIPTKNVLSFNMFSMRSQLLYLLDFQQESIKWGMKALECAKHESFVPRLNCSVFHFLFLCFLFIQMKNFEAFYLVIHFLKKYLKKKPVYLLLFMYVKKIIVERNMVNTKDKFYKHHFEDNLPITNSKNMGKVKEFYSRLAEKRSTIQMTQIFPGSVMSSIKCRFEQMFAIKPLRIMKDAYNHPWDKPNMKKKYDGSHQL